MRTLNTATPILALAFLTISFTANAHSTSDGQPHGHTRSVPFHGAQSITIAQNQTSDKVSGQGEFAFRVLHTGAHLPPEAVAVLIRAHGGFAVDEREGRGEIYFALPGAGIIKLSSDCSVAQMLPTPPEMRDTNMHNATIWQDEGGEPYLVFPANDAGKVFTTTLGGTLVNTLEPPTEFNFAESAVNEYFENAGKFIPTDVEYLGNLYYITTGYSPLDFVLTAAVESDQSVATRWNALAFAGRGTAAGQLGTGHGITLMPDGENLAVADRPNSEIDRFTAQGKYLDTLSLPKGSFPCDIDYTDGYSVVGCLHGPDREKGAPIYVLKGDEVISTVMPKEELGLANFTHIHNAVMIKRNDRFYIIAQAWNPGDFAVLEQVK